MPSQRHIHAELDRLYRADLAGGLLRLPPQELASLRLVVFSDQHRGTRDGADDFLAAERAYNAALAWYHVMGYTLLLLGDVDELWENLPGQVLAPYRATLALERRFHDAGRLLRVWGNHDDEWRYPAQVKRLLDPFFPGLQVHEGVLLPVQAAGTPLGALLFAHGHQGELLSDRFGAVSRWLVRWLWRPVQRFFRIPTTTPATSWDKWKDHDRDFHAWTATHPGVVLTCGHTHRPIFLARTHTQQLLVQIADMERHLAAAPDDPGHRARLAELRAELEWVEAQQGAPRGGASDAVQRPSYFNTGCSSFADGDITGLEFAEGQVRLIKWPDERGRPLRKVLASADLEAILKAVRAPA